LDSGGHLFISDLKNQRIRRVDLGANAIDTIAGGIGDGGLATASTIRNPWGVATDSNGNLYFSYRSPENVGESDLHLARLLNGALKHKLAVLAISFAILVILVQTWMLGIGLEKPVEFFPAIDPKSVYVNIDPPEGADLDYMDNVVRQTERAILADPHGDPALAPGSYSEAYRPQAHRKNDGTPFKAPGDINNIEHIYARVDQGGGGFSFDSNLPNHIGIQFVDYKDRKSPTAADVEILRDRVRTIAGARITVDEQEEGPPTGAPINIEISGNEFDRLGLIAEKVRHMVARIPHVEDVRDDYVQGLPSVRVRIDRQKAALFGFSTSAIGAALKTAYNGLDVTTYYEGDEDYDITVTLGEEDRRVTDVLNSLMIPTTSGEIVPLTTLATIEYTGSVGDIVRINHERVVTVKANVDETKIPGAVARTQAEALVAELPLPPGYQLKFTGENEEQQDSQDFLTRAFVVAIFLIFLILVTLFNSVTQPLIILTSVILSLGGAFLGLYAIDSPFGIIMSGVGVISLAGVVVNNAIVLIDYTNKLRKQGLSLNAAVVSAGATRLRPVVLTAVTTVLGLIPMVTGVSYDFHVMAISWASESTQWWRSMSIVVIFGLMVATMLTLVVVPTLYALIEDSKGWFTAIYCRMRRWYWAPFAR
jgi:multidrug efflux pump subunit AcrB